MIREQALQIGALRIQQAYRGRVQAAELQRIRHVRGIWSTILSFQVLLIIGCLSYVREGGREEQESCVGSKRAYLETRRRRRQGQQA